MPMNAPLVENEREGLLAFLEHQRQAVRYAAYGLREDQARLTPTASGLSVGGLVEASRRRGAHVDRSGRGLPPGDASFEDYMASFVLSGDETLAGSARAV